jgi:lipopolysaccharide export LptBFGC system permease protein LptF
MHAKSPLTKNGNPLTMRKHRQEFAWQIILPLCLGLALILALAVGTTLGASGQVSRWSAVSLIWLIMPMFLVTVLVILVLVAVVVGLIVLIQRLPYYALQVQDLFWLISHKVRQAANSIAEPVLRANQLAAGLKAMWRKKE